MSVITQAGGQARALSLDVTDCASVRGCFEELANWETPDVLVKNNGVTVTRPVLQQTQAEFDILINTNLKGC
jgi:NADP-dependent 3-hydroxy acid dehydrogenase YdfG